MRKYYFSKSTMTNVRKKYLFDVEMLAMLMNMSKHKFGIYLPKMSRISTQCAGDNCRS